MTASSDTGRPLESTVERVGDGLPQEVYVFELGVQLLYARDAEWGVELYKRAGTTTDPEVMADHDGPVIVDGSFRRIETSEYGRFLAYHPHGGQMGALDETPVDEPAVLLEEVERRV